MKKLICMMCLLTAAFGCGDQFVEQAGPGIQKADVDQQDGKGDHLDYCAIYDWYGDGVCDTFCAQPDVADCRTPCDEVCALQNPSGSCLRTGDCVASCEANPDTLAEHETCVTENYMCYQTIESCVASQQDFNTCSSLCANRGENTGCSDRTDCVDECLNRVDDWTETEADAFTTCTTEYPLCYRTLGQCIDHQITRATCADVCEVRRGENSVCFSESDCNDYCPVWGTEDSLQKYIECVNAPLCYRTIEDCMQY